ALADQTVDYATTPWACVKDNITGLTWEVKTDDGGLHDKDWTYRWYDIRYPDPTLAPNKPPNQGQCDSGWACLTGALANLTNKDNLCGRNNWRLPSSFELFGLMGLDSSQAEDLAYFPNPSLDVNYWTTETDANNLAYARYLSNNYVQTGKKSSAYHVRLVSDPPKSN
ncbi:MAG TPA: DUF1566 domain-containing protein, partial [Thiolinea sp.]|nr:DUF1566 domain-containing protein [Thiolinea sp.]